MMKRMALALLGLLFLAGLTPSYALEKVGTPHIVLIGIDKYTDPTIKDRKHAEADAQALYDLFASKEHWGVDAKHIKLLLGAKDDKRGAQSATRANILAAFDWLEKNAGKEDLVVVGIFGEGAPVGERSAYFAVDSTFKGRDKDAVASGDIENHLNKLKSQRFVAFVDVNFLGFNMPKDQSPDPNLQNFYREFLGSEEAKEPPSRTVFLANNGLKPSLDLEKHGVFATVLVDGLNGAADTEGYEADGNITVAELVKYVRKEQPERVRAAGKTNDEKSQTPVIIEMQAIDFVVEHNPKTYPQAAERLAKFQKLAEEKNLAKEVLEEGTNFLSRMPKLEAQQKLRKAYQKLAEGKQDVAAFEAERKGIQESTMIADRDATNYAVMVLRAVKVVRQGFVKDVNQADLVKDAVEGLFKALNEKIPSAIEEKVKNIKSSKEADQLALLTDARKLLGKREDLANGKDITFSLHSMLGKLDKHTDYIDPETLTRMTNDIQGHFSGIGVQIRKNNIKDQLQVVTPILNSPAYKAKIFANDIITTIIREVDDKGKKLEKPEVLPTKGMTTDEAVKKILGVPGTPVRVLVEREGEEKPLEFNLIRGKVEVESVMGAKRNADDTWNYVVDPENKICYVRLTQFSSNTYRDLDNVMRKLTKAGIKGFILDLRFNPGGLLDQAVKISDLFIEDGLIVTIRPRNGAETSYVGRSDGSYTAFPMVCLVNGGSASASEIVSACLQDHARAIIIGTRSYGKGSVQTIHSFDTGGKLKLTTATFWRPSNRNLNKSSTKGRDEDEWGVTPNEGFDIKLSVKDLNDLQDAQRDTEIIRRPGDKNAEAKEFKDRQMEAALDYLRNQIKLASKATVQNTK